MSNLYQNSVQSRTQSSRDDNIIKIIIADDHALIREGLAKVVKRTNDIKIIDEVSNGLELMDVLNKELPDILILDITMPEKSGLDALKDIKEIYPELPVLILSMHPEDRFAIRALKSGAAGYLTKASMSDELLKAIRKIVIEKKRYISSEVAEQLAEQVDINSEKPLHKLLSDREYQVICMIAAGKKMKEIADELSLSLQTVHTYRTRIKEKMNLKSNVEMTRYAIENNLID
jgi:DNA-binding NarL/FixJ family response regulator